MKLSKRLFFVGLVVLIALLVMVFPASAKKKIFAGDRINVFTGIPTTYSADVPFHIKHGWFLTPGGGSLGKYSFELEVDGVYVDWDWRENSPSGGQPNIITRRWVFNFPDGLEAGEYEFIGHWYGPCQDAVESGYYPCPCDHPNDIVEWYTNTLYMTFTP
jgi:hypothetical protein